MVAFLIFSIVYETKYRSSPEVPSTPCKLGLKFLTLALFIIWDVSASGLNEVSQIVLVRVRIREGRLLIMNEA